MHKQTYPRRDLCDMKNRIYVPGFLVSDLGSFWSCLIFTGPPSSQPNLPPLRIPSTPSALDHLVHRSNSFRSAPFTSPYHTPSESADDFIRKPRLRSQDPYPVSYPWPNHLSTPRPKPRRSRHDWMKMSHARIER
jgi:hypothetical protein